METIKNADDLSRIEDNSFIGVSPIITNSAINFNGVGNIFYCEEGVNLKNCNINFKGNNSLIMLGRSKHAYMLDLSVYNNCSVVFGRDNYCNGALHIVVSEECSVLIGDGCFFSFGIWMRTADPHLVYEIESGNRINMSKNVIIGDHVWLGQNVMLLKGATIGSGTIVGAMGVVPGKMLKSNCAYAGNPVKLVKEGCFWDGASVHAWTEETTRSHMHMDGSDYVFCNLTDAAPSIIERAQRLRGGDAKKRLNEFLSFNYDKAIRSRYAVNNIQKPEGQARRKPENSSENSNPETCEANALGFDKPVISLVKKLIGSE